MSSPVHKVRDLQVKLHIPGSFCRLLWRHHFNLQLDWGFYPQSATLALLYGSRISTVTHLLASLEVKTWWRRSWHKQCGWQQTWNIYKHCSWYQLLLRVEQQLAGNTEDAASPSSASAATHRHRAKGLHKGLHAKRAKACFRRQVFLIFTNPDNWI